MPRKHEVDTPVLVHFTGVLWAPVQVPTMRESTLRGVDWSAVAQAQREGAFGAAAAEQTELRRKSLLTSLDALCAMEPEQASREVCRPLLPSHELPACCTECMLVWHCLTSI